MSAAREAMQLAILTAVLAAIASAEAGGGPVVGLAWRLLLVGSSTLIAPLAALVGSHRLAATLADDERSEVAASWFHAIIAGLWLAAVAIILLVAQWPRIVRGNLHLDAWPLIDELAILLPVVVSLLLLWAALYRLERAAQVVACQHRHVEPPPPRLMRYLWLNVRHQLALVLLPPLAVVGLFETLTSLKIPSVNLDVAWWFMLPLVGMMLVLMPAAVRRIWRTTPLDGPLRETVDAVCRERRSSVRDVLIWHTDGTMANAAVVGLSRWLRYLLLTDVLVTRLSDEQIAAVVRHELAHLRRWHLPLRLAVLLLPVAWWLALKQAWPGVEPLIEATIGAMGIRPPLVTAFGVPLAMLAYAVVVLGWYSRLLEHDADLDASLAEDGQLDPILAADFCQALLVLCGPGGDSWFGQWLHPPVAARVELLRRMLLEPTCAAAFRRRLAAINIAIAALYATALLAAIW